MDVGTTLRTAREHRGIPLPRLAATTKIPVGILEALERNDFDRLPHGIFVRGYIRACARELGLEPEALVAQFLAETEPPAPMSGIAPDDGPLEEGPDPNETDPDLAEPSRADWGYVLIVAALLIGFVSMNRSGTPGVPDRAETAVAVASADVTAPVPDAGVQPMLATAEERAIATSGAGLSIELRAQGLCWIRAMVDGEVVVERLLQPGESQLLDADADVILRVGDPGALVHTVNGRPGEPLGRPGMPVTVRFTTDGRHTLAS